MTREQNLGNGKEGTARFKWSQNECIIPPTWYQTEHLEESWKYQRCSLWWGLLKLFMTAVLWGFFEAVCFLQICRVV